MFLFNVVIDTLVHL